MKWLLENYTFEENLETIKKVITQQGMQYQICNNLPFDREISIKNQNGQDDTLQTFTDSIYNQPPMFAYGSIQLIQSLQRSKFAVVTFCNFDQFKCSYYYPRLGKYLLQQEYAFIPYGELNRRADWILEKIGRQGQVFIRPDDGSKSFTGQLVSVETWDRDINLIGFYDLPKECMCVVAEPRNIKNEYRFVIGTDYPYDEHPQRVISGSCYKSNGKLIDNPTDEINANLLQYVESVIADIDYRPDPFWILDIAETYPQYSSISKFHILETGSMSCSGLYGCDLNKIIQNISDYLKAEWNEMKPKPEPKPSFEEIIQKFQSEELNVNDWNFCISYGHSDDYKYGAFIMGEGAEQCLTMRWGYQSEQEVLDIYASIGVTKRIKWL